MQEARAIRVERCHRIGKKSTSTAKPRTVIIRFNWYADRVNVWSKRRELAGTKLYLKEDFSRDTEEARKVLYPYVKAARVAKVPHSVVGDKLIIKGKPYTRDTIAAIPADIDPVRACTRQNENTVIFHGRDSPFSNFHHAPFTVNNVQFNSSEQFYQLKRAEYFEDKVTAQKIKQQNDPLECMRLGRKVKGFDEDAWHKVDENYMIDANVAKYTQK